jgi:hypothetical protein
MGGVGQGIWRGVGWRGKGEGMREGGRYGRSRVRKWGEGRRPPYIEVRLRRWGWKRRRRVHDTISTTPPKFRHFFQPAGFALLQIFCKIRRLHYILDSDKEMSYAG